MRQVLAKELRIQAALTEDREDLTERQYYRKLKKEVNNMRNGRGSRTNGTGHGRPPAGKIDGKESG